MSKEYKVTLPSLLFNYAAILAFVIFAIFMLFHVVLNPNQEMRWFALLWILVVLVFMLPYGLRMPHTMIINEMGKIVFKSLISEREFEINQLKSIKTSIGNSTLLIFKFNHGRISVINHIDKLHELINDLQSINKDIETRGC